MGKHAECIYVNHGLTSLSAVLKQHGHVVSLIDLRECKSWQDFSAWVTRENADVYGVYMQTLDFVEAVKCNSIIKAKGYRTVVGGPHPSIMPEQVLKETNFDFVFKGEGEVTFPKFLDDMGGYDRLIVGEHPDLDSLPFEDYGLFNLDKVFATKHPFFSQPYVSVISGRGCPFNCSFCKPGEDYIFGRFRMKSARRLLAEIKHLNRLYDFSVLMVDDDAFTVNVDAVHSFCESYSKEVGKPFVCQSRADFIAQNPDVVKEMRDAGLWMFIVGFESNNQRVLNLLRKGTTVEQNWKAAEVCRKLGVKVWANYMLGLPTETKEEVKETVNFIRKTKPFHPSASFFTPIFGTDLYDYSVENELLVSEDPSLLGCRSVSDVPRIKGVDYGYLTKQVSGLNLSLMSTQQKVRKGLRRALRVFKPRMGVQV